MISKNMIILCSLNVNGIHGREKRNRVVEWIKTQKCSIAFYQETHLDENIENEIKNKTIENTVFSICMFISIILPSSSVNLSIIS
jgi:exonuclease III